MVRREVFSDRHARSVTDADAPQIYPYLRPVAIFPTQNYEVQSSHPCFAITMVVDVCCRSLMCGACLGIQPIRRRNAPEMRIHRWVGISDSGVRARPWQCGVFVLAWVWTQLGAQSPSRDKSFDIVALCAACARRRPPVPQPSPARLAERDRAFHADRACCVWGGGRRAHRVGRSVARALLGREWRRARGAPLGAVAPFQGRGGGRWAPSSAPAWPRP